MLVLFARYPYPYPGSTSMFGRRPAPEATLAEFTAAHAEGALTVDVREAHEYVMGHVPGARSVPLAALAQQAAALAADAEGRPVFVICASGHRSKAAARRLAQAGVDARSVAGGTAAWARAGQRVAVGGRRG